MLCYRAGEFQVPTQELELEDHPYSTTKFRRSEAESPDPTKVWLTDMASRQF
jgi:hypothetical protein